MTPDFDNYSLCEAVFDSAASDDALVEQDLEAVHRTLGFTSHKTERKVRVWRRVALVAAAIALPLAVASGIMFRNSRPVEYLQLTVPECGQQTLALSDGTVLTLGSGTSVIYPQTFRGKQRRIFLDGQVFAEVSKDPRHPFVIHSGDVEVKVYGTKFNFKSWTDADQVELCLLEGAVTMALSDNSRDVVLTPGDMVRYSRKGGDYELCGFDSADYGPDDVNALRFNNEPLSEIACELEKVFGVRIAIVGEKLANRRFFSYFTNGESLDDILDALCADGMKMTRQGDELIIITTK